MWIIRHCLVRLVALIGLLAAGHAVAQPTPTARPTTAATTSPTTRSVNLWEREIAAFEAADATSKPAMGAILFVGSSSIRGWRTLREDFPHLDVINRGFGGSHIIDVVRYAERIVLKYRPRTIVFYAGENDLASRQGDRPDDVLRHFQAFVDVVHRELPETRILFISLKPSPSRLQFLDAFRTANEKVRAYTEGDERLGFIDVFTPMLDENGQPRADLFLEDRLHMTPAGYDLWKRVVGPHLAGSKK